jgi:hypothetical protein
VRHAESGSRPAGIVQIVERAARSEGGTAVLPGPLIVELHRHADDVVTVIGHERRGDRRIDAARHRDDDAHQPALLPTTGRPGRP